MPEVPAVHAWDRGLHYGDGLFETMAVRNGHIALLDLHIDRLQAGCERLRIALSSPGQIRADVCAAAATLGNGVVKVIVTRGIGGRGYAPPVSATPTVLLLHAPAPDWPATHGSRGVRLRVCTTQVSRNPSLGGLKTLNRLEQVLARAEWEDPDIAEGLMLDEAGNVIEATSANLYMVCRGRLQTPRLDRSGVAGVMRRVILEQARELGIVTEECEIGLETVMRADEVFLSNAVAGIWPVRRIDQRRFDVGPVTKRICASIRRAGLWP